MKILFVISSLNPGGAERVMSNMANYWSSRARSVSLVTFSGNASFYPLNKNIKHIPIAIDRPSRSGLDLLTINLRKAVALREVFNLEKPDIIISFMVQANLISIIAAIGMNIPLIVSERTTIDYSIKKQWRLLRRILYQRASTVVLLSSYDYSQYTFLKNKLIIQNPISLECCANNFEIHERAKIILGVGRLDVIKGFDMLIKAFSLIKLPDWKLVLVGDGPERAKLEDLARTNNISDKVIFEGVKNNVHDYYSQSSIFVLSSRMEGFPNALCEAMSHGLACVSFNCRTGPADIVTDGDDGFLVEPENTEQLAQKIKLLASNQTLRETMGNSAKNIREKLNIDTIMTKWDNLTKTMIEHKAQIGRY